MNPASKIGVHALDFLEVDFHESRFHEIEYMNRDSRMLDEWPMTFA